MRAADGWYYCKTVLGEDSSVTFEESLFNPEGESWSGQRIEAESVVEAQAIQARNVTPDFASDRPWGDVAPEVCIYSRTQKGVA